MSNSRRITVVLVLMSTVQTHWLQADQLHLIKNEQPLTYTATVAPTNAASANAPQTLNTALVQASSSGPDAGQMTLLSSSSGGTTNARPAGTTSTSWPATITVKGKQYGMRPNPLGVYPRLTVPSNASIGIQLHVTSQSVVRVIVLDGGSVVKKSHVSSHTADTNGNVSLTYQAPGDPGSHRLTVLAGGQKQTLNFWIGPDLFMKAVKNKN